MGLLCKQSSIRSGIKVYLTGIAYPSPSNHNSKTPALIPSTCNYRFDFSLTRTILSKLDLSGRMLT